MPSEEPTTGVVSAGPGKTRLEAELKRVRLESGTLYEIVRVIAASAQVPEILAGVVELLTKATRCHACMVYLRDGDQLRLRGASRSFSQLIDQISIPIGEGLVGWAMRNGQPALARDNALADPRFHLVPELEEESFQSMAAVAIPARQGPSIGAISVHTQAPHEFDEEIVTFLVHTASLLAGAIETAQLYEESSRRVETLMTLGRITERIAATDNREILFDIVASGAVELLACEGCEIHITDPATGHLQLAAASGGSPAEGDAAASSRAAELLSAPVMAGGERLGELRVHLTRGASSDQTELLGALANQTAVAIKRTELIERLTEDFVARDLFAALLAGDGERSRATAKKLALDLEAEHLVIRAVVVGQDKRWPERSDALESDLRQLGSRITADVTDDAMTALLATGSQGQDDVEQTICDLANRHSVMIGISDPHRGPDRIAEGIAEATDAVEVVRQVSGSPGARSYRDLGVYRYLVRLPSDRVPRDGSWAEVERLAAYDRQRQTQLIDTLERYLGQRGSIGAAAEQLHVHPNTVRQRLDRIEELTEIDLKSDDLLALEVAVKLFRLSDDQH